ncbi:Hypothetical predicted protein [Lecanosticta acicola]|uniref:Ysc84 actin-binding domain-containing protein n=1 Tax=Lecanosticta acicola TaxID=111012 RepID=A0AAI8W1M1_9PEZI|nr:Hypothetical predicted protein [Lecanosticta acicola]
MSQAAGSTLWQRVKGGSKTGFDKTWKALDRLGAPVNKLSNKLGSEAFWPTTLDKESDKAARILKSFCKDGFYAEEEFQPEDGPKQKQKVVQKIPEKVIRNAKGLAIFTTMRTGLWVSGAGGSGILVARKADGTWSPPSGILLHTAGLGFLVGVDIYDCVIVINTEEALQAFTKVRCTLGSEISVSAGPVGAGGVLETEIHKRQAPIYTYLKSRGFYAGVQIDGTIVIERTDENERFYGEKMPVLDILAGRVRHPPLEIARLMETIKAAQGDSDFDENLLPTEAPPGDFEIDHNFGVPDKDDPDPYGVLALEKEGMSLKEAGTKKRASWEEFTFSPSPSSPIHSIYARPSVETNTRSGSRRNSWRTSTFSTDPKTPSSLRNSTEVRSPSLMIDSSTQTDLDLADSTPMSPERRSIRSQHSSGGSISANGLQIQMQDVPENEVLETDHRIRQEAKKSTANGYNTPPHTPPATATTHGDATSKHARSEDGEIGDDEDTDDEEEVQVIEQPAVTIPMVRPTVAEARQVNKARIVEVPKRFPPKLPPRNPGRAGSVVADASSKDASTDPASSLNSSRRGSPASDTAKNGAHSVVDKKDDSVAEKMQSVKLDDDEDEEDDLRPNPWAKVEEMRRHEGEEKMSAKIPGGFD